MKKTNSKSNTSNKNATGKYTHTMKTVTSHTCSVCKSPCARGMAYLEKMQVPGASGKGVPCHLTKGRL